MQLQDLQHYLTGLHIYLGRIDNDWGDLSRDACRAFLTARHVKWTGWNDNRLRTAASQQMCADFKIEVGKIDGLMGEQTRYAFRIFDAKDDAAKLQAETTWRDDPNASPPSDDNKPPVKLPPVETLNLVKPIWPRQADVIRFYGPVGQNQTDIVFPYPCRIAWDLGVKATHTSIHEKVHDSALRVMNRVFSHYGLAEIQRLRLDLFGGCLNVRKMRGGSSWSMHSWGIAMDWDPDRNQLKQNHTQAEFARADYKTWFELWEAEGWLSLGRARDYDWMHVQAARL